MSTSAERGRTEPCSKRVAISLMMEISRLLKDFLKFGIGVTSTLALATVLLADTAVVLDITDRAITEEMLRRNDEQDPQDEADEQAENEDDDQRCTVRRCSLGKRTSTPCVKERGLPECSSTALKNASTGMSFMCR